jgi:putative membrane protein
MKSDTEPNVAVDLRIFQANERTLLAWIRTGLALMGFGFVVARVGVWLSDVPDGHQGTPAAWIGAALLTLGTVCNVAAAARYLRIRRALLEGRPIIPSAVGVVLLAFGLAVLGAMLAAHVLLD